MLDKLGDTRVRVLLILLAVLLIGLFLWIVPKLQVENFAQAAKVTPKDALAQENEYRRTWAQIIAGSILFAGLYFTWRRVEISQRTLEATRDQQVTERFTRAIDQLGETDDKTGKPKLEIRLGGIYALERIARDSPKRDYSTVMEVLTAYARENATYSPISSLYEDPDEEVAEQEAVEPQEQSAAIRAIAEVIGRLHGKDGRPVLSLDLHRANLYRANLKEANLKGANFQEASLKKANLRQADLRDAHLDRASLKEADLREADLQDARLDRASLKKADLRGADLSGAYLLSAYLQDSWLVDAKLQGAHLQNAKLQRAQLQRANLQAVQLDYADLQDADLQDADLSEVEGYTLTPCASLQGANLKGANLQGANLSGAEDLTKNQLEEAVGDKHTKLPEGYEHPESWIQGEGKPIDKNE